MQAVIVGAVGNLTVPVWTDEYEFAPKEEQAFVRKYGGELMLDQFYYQICLACLAG